MDRKKIIKDMLHEFFGPDTSRFTKEYGVIISYDDIDLNSLTSDAVKFNGGYDEEKHIQGDNMVKYYFLNPKDAKLFMDYVPDHYDILDIKDQSTFK